MVLSVGNRGSAPQENDLLDGKGASGGLQLKKAAKSVAAQSGKSKKGGEEMLSTPCRSMASIRVVHRHLQRMVMG